MGKRIGDLLLEESLITPDQLQQALEEQQKSGDQVGKILVRKGFITEEALYYFLAIQFGTEYVDLKDVQIPSETASYMKKETAEKFNSMPYEVTPTKIVFVTSDPDDHFGQRIRENLLIPGNIAVSFIVTSTSSMQAALGLYYGSERKTEIDDSLKAILDESSEEEKGLGTDLSETVTEDSTPVIKIVNALIGEAVKHKVSDIHLNPTQKNMVIRYRLDGMLHKQPSPPAHYRHALISRIKVMAKLDIMERRAAQDGRIKIKIQNRIIDLRVSVLPSIYGENVVMRILDQENLMLDLTKLGFEERELDIYREVIEMPYGLILHTGPTGSGKTTTLYSALSTVNKPEKNIITLEDPVEYQLPGIVQIQMNSDIGLTFASALRSCLRQDPNIMMVGEIRDKETADISIKAALTGHLLFSTLHTNDSPSTIMRLIDMGVDPIYVASSVKLIVAQRLLRRICSNCKEPYNPTDEEIQRLMLTRKELEGAKIMKGAGCHKCKNSGNKGRVAIYEILKMTQELADLIFAGADLNDLTRQAQLDGMRTLRQVALEKWRTGVTSFEEVLAATTEA